MYVYFKAVKYLIRRGNVYFREIPSRAKIKKEVVPTAEVIE